MKGSSDTGPWASKDAIQYMLTFVACWMYMPNVAWGMKSGSTFHFRAISTTGFFGIRRQQPVKMETGSR